MLYQFVAMVNGFLAAQDREEGQGMAEYALIIALVAVVLATSLGLFEDSITTIFTNIVTAFTPA